MSTSQRVTYRHIQSGGLYQIITTSVLEADGLTELVTYQNIETGAGWTRPRAEFFDGRFERVEDPKASPAALSVSDQMMDLVDRLGSQYDKVDPRAWRHLLVYAPKASAAPALTDEAVHYVLRQYFDGVTEEKAQNIAHDLRLQDASPAALTAKQRYEECMREGEESSPVERLRFFCGLAMNGQDWLDVEPFFDALATSPAPLTEWEFTKRETGDWIVYSPTSRRWVAYADSNSAELIDAILVTQPAEPAQPEKSVDRAMLEAVSQDLETSTWECARCGHTEDCKTLDAAYMLRDYLSTKPTTFGKPAEPAHPDRQEIESAYQRDFEKVCRAVKFNAETFPELENMSPTGAIGWLVVELAARHEKFADRQGVALSDDEVSNFAAWAVCSVEVAKTVIRDVEARILSRASSLPAEVEIPNKPEDRIAALLKHRMTPYGTLVRALRIVAGTSLYEMAQFMGVSAAQLSGVEFGRKPVTYEHAVAASGFFASKGVPGSLRVLESAVRATEETK